MIEGDQATTHDAERIRATGCNVVQINTGTGCHLEAQMLAQGLDALQPAAGSIVMIENVGNLVCPALFDLGERAKVVILSVTEGDDKPAGPGETNTSNGQHSTHIASFYKSQTRP